MNYKSYCKVNLFLLIKKYNKKNNLHKIQSLFYLVKDFYDEIFFEFNNSKDQIIYLDEKNKKINIKDCILEKTLTLLKSNNILDKNIFLTIKVHKNIPMFSGLGSGSSNAATLIKFLIDKKLIKLNKFLKKIILKIGSDTMFFVKNHELALVWGYGNKVRKIKNKKNFKIDLFFTNLKCETKKVFEYYKKNDTNNKTSILKQLFYFKINKYNLLVNELEGSCFLSYPEMKKQQTKLCEKHQTKIFLSGSGSSFFKII